MLKLNKLTILKRDNIKKLLTTYLQAVASNKTFITSTSQIYLILIHINHRSNLSAFFRVIIKINNLKFEYLIFFLYIQIIIIVHTLNYHMTY